MAIPDKYKVNPDSAILGQLDEHWFKITALLLWKLNGLKPITLRTRDFQEFAKCCGVGVEPTMLTHGHNDGFTLQIVTPSAAKQLAQFDATQRGKA